jgi:hypothetical protein
MVVLIVAALCGHTGMGQNQNQGVIAVGLGLATAIIPTAILFLMLNLLFWIPLAVGLVFVVLGIRSILKDSWLSQRVGWFALGSMILVVGGTFGITAYLDRSGPPVVIIVPNGFRGPIKLSVDSKNGAEIPLADGRYTVRIPASGHLVIKSADPFTQWHSETAMFENGESLSKDHENRLPPEKVRLIDLGSRLSRSGHSNDESLNYFVGNEFDFRLFKQGKPGL